MAAILLAFLPVPTEVEGNDAAVLLNGVRSRREQAPPTTLEIRFVSTGSGSTDESLLVVDFEGGDRRFATRRHFGDATEIVSRTIFGSGRIHHFASNFPAASIRNPTDMSVGELLFDPRLIGLTGSYSLEVDLELALPSQASEGLSLSDVAVADGTPLKEVSFTNAFGSRVRLWIDPQKDFRVYRHDVASVGGRTISESDYEHSEYPWLPKRVVTTNFDADGTPLATITLEIRRAEFPQDFSEATWGLPGLDLPVNTPVDDVTLMRRVGYWNGTDLQPEPVRVGTPNPPNQDRSVPVAYYLSGAAIAVLAVALGLFLRRRGRAK
jgi:hypothetical protein